VSIHDDQAKKFSCVTLSFIVDVPCSFGGEAADVCHEVSVYLPFGARINLEYVPAGEWRG